MRVEVPYRSMVNAVLLSCVCYAATSYAEEFTNHIGMTFVDIPAGKFYMGSCRQDNSHAEENKKRAFLGLPPLGGACPSGASMDNLANEDETPQHEVKLSAFQIGQYEVSLRSFKRYLAESGKTDWVTPVFIQFNASGDSAPVTMVSWNDAQDFVAWLNKSKPVSDKAEYRLPSEAEWEYVARAKTKTLFAHGDELAALADYAWTLENGEHKTHPSGQKKPNVFGVYDMAGNVWEWTQDCWHANYVDAPNNGKAWEARSCDARVLRGGSWDFTAKLARSAYRQSLAAERVSFDIGFRVVRVPAVPPAGK